MKKKFLFFTMFGLNLNLHPSATITQQLINIVDVVQALKAVPGTNSAAASTSTTASGSSQTNTAITPPSTPLISSKGPFWYPSNGSCSAPFTAINALTGAAYNSPAVSCSGGLQLLNVGLTDATGSAYYAFNFGSIILTELIPLMAQGMYIAINMITSNSKNLVQVCLTDINGNIFAQSASPVLPAGCGFVYANIGFNMSDTLIAPPANGTYVNWMPIANGQRIFYQDQGAATTVTTAPIGKQTMPVVSPAIAAMTSSLVVQVPWNQIAGCYCKAPFTQVNSLTGVTANATAPISCQGGLQNLYVFLTANDGCYIARTIFPSTVLSQPAMQTLISKGMYIAINMLQNNGTNYAQVALTDQAGNIYAQSSTVLPVGTGFITANIGFNISDTLGALNSSQAVLNGFVIGNGQRVLYQQAASTSAATTTTQTSSNTTVPAPFVPLAFNAISGVMNVNGTVPSATAANTNLTMLTISPTFLSGNFSELQIETVFPAALASINQSLQQGHNVSLYINIVSPSATGSGQDLQFAAYDVITQSLLASGVFSSILSSENSANSAIIATNDSFSNLSLYYQYANMSNPGVINGIAPSPNNLSNLVSIVGYVAPAAPISPSQQVGGYPQGVPVPFGYGD